MSVLVDSSVWIDYFRGTSRDNLVTQLIDESRVTTNELILAELIPSLLQRKLPTLVSLLREIKRQPMDIDWDEIIRIQSECLSKGINGVGIPDLIIAQNAVQGGLNLLTNDKHFALIAPMISLELYH